LKWPESFPATKQLFFVNGILDGIYKSLKQDRSDQEEKDRNPDKKEEEK